MAFSILFCTVLSSPVYAEDIVWAFDKDVGWKGGKSILTVSNPHYNASSSANVTFPYSRSFPMSVSASLSSPLTGFVNGGLYDCELTLKDVDLFCDPSSRFTNYSGNIPLGSNLYVWMFFGSDAICLGKYALNSTYTFSAVAVKDRSYFTIGLSTSNSAWSSDVVAYGNVSCTCTFPSNLETYDIYVFPFITGHLKYKLHVDKTVQEEIRDEIKKGNELQKEQNETSKGILGKITDFFGSFFENLKGLFVPEDGYFSDFFTRLNDFFSEKLGMLYAPIDMFITFLNTIKDASSSDSGITFPELSWDDTVIIPETKFSFNTITKDFPDLQEKIYFVTDVILVGAVLWLLQVKLKEVLEN